MYVRIDVVTGRKIRWVARNVHRVLILIHPYPVDLHIRRELQLVERDSMRESIAETKVDDDVLRVDRQHVSTNG